MAIESPDSMGALREFKIEITKQPYIVRAHKLRYDIKWFINTEIPVLAAQNIRFCAKLTMLTATFCKNLNLADATAKIHLRVKSSLITLVLPQ